MLTIEKVSEDEVRFGGRFDASQAEKATEELSRLHGTITIDMKELDYISSMGLSVLVNVYKRLNEDGHTLRLTNLSKHVRDVFRYTRLDQVFVVIERE